MKHPLDTAPYTYHGHVKSFKTAKLPKSGTVLDQNLYKAFADVEVEKDRPVGGL